MTFEEAKALLSQSVRDELRDHAFGDREIYWTTVGGEYVASGYCGEGIVSVTVGETYFIGKQAAELVILGRIGKVERNDSTGPDEYQDGQVMEGLTLDGVAKELAKEGPSLTNDLVFRVTPEEIEYYNSPDCSPVRRVFFSLEYLDRKIKLFCDHHRLTGDHAKDRRRINNLSLNTKLAYRHYLKMREAMIKQAESTV